jgi:hypothetical protein
LRAVYHLAAELLALFGIDEPTLLKADGTPDPYGDGVDRQQIVFRYANHLGLPAGEVSPGERPRRFRWERPLPAGTIGTNGEI